MEEESSSKNLSAQLKYLCSLVTRHLFDQCFIFDRRKKSLYSQTASHLFSGCNVSHKISQGFLFVFMSLAAPKDKQDPYCCMPFDFLK